MTIAAEPATAARQQASDAGAAQYLERLVRSDPAAGGMRRRRCGRGFRCLAASGPVTDPGILARIKALVIPPAWEDVWICGYLGNTPAVASASYIDPRVIRHYENGRTIAAVLGDLGRGSDFGDLATRGRAESAVLKLLTLPAQPRTRL
jgi:DNA topoisomerase IB